ncbi:MAG: hypothetical protein ACREVL_02680 [Solimonas sp.]
MAWAAMVAACALLAACGSSADAPNRVGDGGANGAISTAAGIYYGHIGSGSDAPEFFGLVTKNGKARFVEKDGTDYTVITPAPVLPADDGTFSVDYFRYVAGSRDGGGVFAGTWAKPALGSAGISGTLGDGSGSRDFDIDYVASDYERAASLEMVAGTYSASYTTNGQTLTATLTINSDGSLSGSGDGNCTYGGGVSVPDATRNGYEIALNPSCFTGNFSGVGAYYPAGALQQEALLRFAVSNNNYGFYLRLTKQ